MIIDGEIDRAAGLKIGYLTQDLFWKDVKNTLREEMLQVFPDITAKINRLHEIEGNPEHRDESVISRNISKHTTATISMIYS
jgi:ATPase subunit of ABC transporter with duplicated ATPase domains